MWKVPVVVQSDAVVEPLSMVWSIWDAWVTPSGSLPIVKESLAAVLVPAGCCSVMC